MNRRNFIRTTLTGITVVAGGLPLRALSGEDYLRRREAGIKLRFAIASDGHFGQSGTPFEQYHAEMMAWLNREHVVQPLAFCFFNGDLIHDDPIHLAGVKSMYDRVNTPYYVSRGNHDRCSVDLWRSTWGYDFNHTFSIDDHFFIVADTSNEKGDYLCPDSEWLGDALEKARGFRHSFVFMHITPQKWTRNGVNCRKTVRMLGKQKNLRAIFHGHDHDQDGVKTKSGKSYFFDSHLGGNWGTEYRGYRIVEITNANEVLSYQVNPLSKIRVNTTAGLHL